MNADTIDILYVFYLFFWITTPVFLFLFHSRRNELGGFIVYSYLLLFILNYWFGALVHASPWNTIFNNEDTIVGFQYSTYGLISFIFGVLIVRPNRRNTPNSAVISMTLAFKNAKLEQLERYALWFFLPFGAGCWIATFTPIGSLPSAASILSSGKTFVVLSICLGAWSTWFRGQMLRYRRWVSLMVLLPVTTVVTSGFIGTGIVMTTTVLAFVAMYFRPRWPLLAALCLMLYSGVSFWTAYEPQRVEIRNAVWGGESYNDRFGAFLKVFDSLRPFDMSDFQHLKSVDDRLNQNGLVGAAIRTTPSTIPFRQGDTIFDGLLAIVPRLIWRDKPVVAGSGDYVAIHTQTSFAAGTSVGMGQVLEFYINFGLWGVLIGLFLFGVIFRYMDIRLVDALRSGNWNGVVFYFVVGSAMLQNGGALAEITASAAGAAVLCFISSNILSWSVMSNTQHSIAHHSNRQFRVKHKL